MKEKVCRKCGIKKEIGEYYVHAPMSDGHLNICKDCVRRRVSEYGKTPQGRINEKKRSQSQKRKEWVKRWLPGYVKKNKEKIADRKYLWSVLNRDRLKREKRESEKRAMLNPEIKKRVYARRKLRWHIKKGNIKFDKRCEMCGIVEGLQFHHEDYNKPLEFMVLCKVCHGRKHGREVRHF